MVGGPADGFPEQSILVTFEMFLTSACKAISIKCTKETEENGTYQIIIEDKDYEKTTKHLKILFNVFAMNEDHLIKTKAKEQWGSIPHIDMLFSNSESESDVNELMAFFSTVNMEPEKKLPENNNQYQFKFGGCDSLCRDTNQENKKENIRNTYTRLTAGGRLVATPTWSNCYDQGVAGRTTNNRKQSNSPNETKGDDVNKDGNTQNSPQSLRTSGTVITLELMHTRFTSQISSLQASVASQLASQMELVKVMIETFNIKQGQLKKKTPDQKRTRQKRRKD